MNANRVEDLGAMLEVPPCPVTGRNHKIAWHRGFNVRCWTKTTLPTIPKVPGRYWQSGLQKSFALGWLTAHELIEARRPQ